MIITDINEYTREDLINIANETGIYDFNTAKNPSKPTKQELANEINNAANGSTTEFKSAEPEIKIETLGEKRRRLRKQLFKLRRVIVTELHKIQTYSEDDSNRMIYVSWGNTLMGHHTTKVIFGRKWIMPQGAIDNLKAVVAKDSNLKNKTIVTVDKQAYKIEDVGLPTSDEIAEIAKRQKYRKEAD